MVAKHAPVDRFALQVGWPASRLLFHSDLQALCAAPKAPTIVS
jgi:hypothetical protein